jgi:hypothetical protein
LLSTIYQKLRALFTKPEMNAAQAWRLHGGEAEYRFWLFATPVNMMLGRDSYFLTDPGTTPVSHEENMALIESLNAHFDGFGVCFYLVDDIWFLGLDKNPDITTVHINVVKNQDIADHFPQGKGALVWHQLQNEIQMLLFSHPVNQAREAQGLPIINSLWCYGFGEAD